MTTATLSYLPTRAALWRRALVRQFCIPKRRWSRVLVGPALVLCGVALVSGATPMELSPLGLFGGTVTGIGLGWTLWPFLGAWLAVTLSARVRRGRAPVRLTVGGGVLELVRGEDRTLFALADLERVERVAGRALAPLPRRPLGDRAGRCGGGRPEGAAPGRRRIPADDDAHRAAPGRPRPRGRRAALRGLRPAVPRGDGPRRARRGAGVRRRAAAADRAVRGRGGDREPRDGHRPGALERGHRRRGCGGRRPAARCGVRGLLRPPAAGPRVRRRGRLQPGGAQLGDGRRRSSRQAGGAAIRCSECGRGPLAVQVHHSQRVLALPRGAVPLARSPTDPCHAFRLGERAWGVQFHPEFDGPTSRRFVERHADDRRRDRSGPGGGGGRGDGQPRTGATSSGGSSRSRRQRSGRTSRRRPSRGRAPAASRSRVMPQPNSKSGADWFISIV